VTVGQVVHHLAHGPPAVAVRRVELRVIEAGHRSAKLTRTLGDALDGLFDVCEGRVGRIAEFSNR
jgi:hypothetical protein